MRNTFKNVTCAIFPKYFRFVSRGGRGKEWFCSGGRIGGEAHTFDVRFIGSQGVEKAAEKLLERKSPRSFRQEQARNVIL